MLPHRIKRQLLSSCLLFHPPCCAVYLSKAGIGSVWKRERERQGRIRRGRFRRNESLVAATPEVTQRRGWQYGEFPLLERERERDTESMAQQRDFPIQYIRKWRLLRQHWIHFLCPDTVNSTFYCSSLNPLHMEPWISYVHSSPYKLTSPWPLEQHSHCVFVCLNHMRAWGCLHALVIC